MNRIQWLLLVLFISFALIARLRADSDSDSSDSGSGSEDISENIGESSHNKYDPSAPSATPAQAPVPIPVPLPVPYPGYHYTQPVFMPQVPPPPYGGPYYALSPMPYYYGYQSPPIPYGNPYSYGGYYNRPILVPVQAIPGQGPMPHTHAPPTYGNTVTSGGTSSINHSLKVSREYLEDENHYRSDDTATD